MKIACWSGPRNISTALMRSWSSREDTYVTDEPLYAYYLKETKLTHPMSNEIIEHYDNEFEKVVQKLQSSAPDNKKIWYQKHMAHHLLNTNDIDWIKSFNNFLLIRDPKEVIASYVKKNNLNKIEELGYKQQIKIAEYLTKKNEKFAVIDCKDLLDNPKNILMSWCKFLDISFSEKMLKWKKGNHPNDGIWWNHWYGNVIKTTGFTKLNRENIIVDAKYRCIYNEANDYYRELRKYCL